jgi:hypothetical protein
MEKKILDAEFRKKLFKDLLEAGFEKDEAQNMLYQKLYETLKGETLLLLDDIVKQVENDNIPVSFDGERVNGYLTDMRKAQEVLSKKQAE